jgi:hypothetical protein
MNNKQRIDDNLTRELSELSARDVGQLMEDEFGQGAVIFTYPLTGRTSCANDVVKQAGSHTILASEVSPISFYGGPPGKRQLFRGSLLTLAMDRILYNWTTKNLYTELVVGDGELQRAR